MKTIALVTFIFGLSTISLASPADHCAAPQTVDSWDAAWLPVGSIIQADVNDIIHPGARGFEILQGELVCSGFVVTLSPETRIVRGYLELKTLTPMATNAYLIEGGDQINWDVSGTLDGRAINSGMRLYCALSHTQKNQSAFNYSIGALRMALEQKGGKLCVAPGTAL